MTINELFRQELYRQMAGPLGDDILPTQTAPAKIEVRQLNDESDIAEIEFLRARYGLRDYQAEEILDLICLAQGLNTVEDLLVPEPETEPESAYAELSRIFGPGVVFSDQFPVR